MSGPGWDELPEEFRALIGRSLLLQKRVERIDAALLEDGQTGAAGQSGEHAAPRAGGGAARDELTAQLSAVRQLKQKAGSSPAVSLSC